MIRSSLAMLVLLATPELTAGPWQPANISSPKFESHPAFDWANRTLYLVRSSPQFQGWRLFQSRCDAGRWSEPQPVPFASKGGVEADPFLARDGKSLYFISSRQDDGVKGRGLDLWRVDRSSPKAAWGKPVRLPEPLNSAGNEWFPRLARDGWLYFGSDRSGGLGATDIYRARQIKGVWQVVNLGPEVNSAGDDYEADISPNGKSMLLMADGDLFELTSRNGKWGGRKKLGPEINTDKLEVGPLYSPSGRSFIFARDMGDGAGAGELVLAGKGKAETWPPQCR